MQRCLSAYARGPALSRPLLRPSLSSPLHTSSWNLAKTAKAAPQLKKKIKMTDKVVFYSPYDNDVEFAEKAGPLLETKPRINDLELPDLIETPIGIRRVTETTNGELALGETVFQFTDELDLAVSGDIRNLDNVTYRKKVSRFVKRMAELHRIFSSPNTNAFLPRINLLVEYPAEQLVYWGIEYGPKMVSTKPKVSWNSYLSNRMWTLVMLGQEVEKPQVAFDHWVVGNIPGSNIDGGNTLSQYIPASPFKDGDLHRYTFVLLSQDGPVDFKEAKREDDLTQRSDFNLRTFMAKHKLRAKGLCWFYSKASADIPGFYDRLNVGIEADFGEDGGEEVDLDAFLEMRKSMKFRPPTKKPRLRRP